MKKTKAIPLQVEAWAQHDGDHIEIERGQIEYVSQFKYFGSISAVGLTMQPEIANRIAKAGNAFHKLIKLWGDKHLSREVKCTVYTTVVQATLLYGCETWAAPKALTSGLDTFQMRCLRRICGISLWEKKTNKFIRGLCKIEAISTTVKYCRLLWLAT